MNKYFKIPSDSVFELEGKLLQVKEVVKKYISKEYHKWIGLECEKLVNAMDLEEIDINCSVLDEAIRRTNKRIEFAEQKGIVNNYNLKTLVKILSYKSETYLKIETCQEEIIKSVQTKAGFTACELTKEDKEVLDDLYNEEDKIVLVSFVSAPIEVDLNKLEFSSIKERAKKIAYANFIEFVYNSYVCGEKIMSAQTFVEVEKLLASGFYQKEYEAEILNIIPKLSKITVENIVLQPDM